MELTRRHTGIRVSPGRRAFVIINTIVLLLVSAIMLYPAIYVIAASFSEETAILRGDVFLIPVRAHVKAYQKVFVYPMLWQSYRNTLIYTFLGTAINLVLTVFGAWALSQKKMVGRRFLTLMCTFTMFFGGGMIPTFLVVKGLGLLNTIWAILLPSAVSTYNMILMRTFFRQIPESLVEAAELDGCRDFGVLFRIVLPLSLASLMTIGMFYAVGHWNSYFPAVMYLTTNKELNPLQIILRQVVLLNEIVENASSTENVMAEGIKYATIVVAMLPMLCIYPFVQRYFVKGVMVGSVKE
ncbi:carbohydrate ABC transporter permease [Aristaeella hokkaidonensis]|uniref:Carbohydrate ABC transporter permease n=1 Tax=Aristaeella hokkaidonensis TaxID=3046382 RepID=A0AC61MXA6_9FIRM|nr:carbohydrate ABC transporter permease [Aristaeella hokkaidonensis]QUC67387.1 carbohydrate ABC transporter permease [Aristaeella hokkaidonensis]SNT93274.1 carbohydrate ABC transporter membrane protein 2, CUT1 family [Aristaeella hokkaidonensis]